MEGRRCNDVENVKFVSGVMVTDVADTDPGPESGNTCVPSHLSSNRSQY